LIDNGVPEEQARLDARRQFGNVTKHLEDSRAAWGWDAVERTAKDLQFGYRLLVNSPGFTLAALLTLTLGIGAAISVFSLVNSVILKPLAYHDSSQLVVAWE
jgi:hypothetical protein